MARARAGLAVPAALPYRAEPAAAGTSPPTAHPPIIHGDVKPANLILTRGGRVKVVDFGLSSMLGMGAHASSTAGFRAPELNDRAPPSRESDVYALAATAYALLAGAPPADAPPPWEGFDGSQAARLESWSNAGLAADPERRPA